jgi:general secretion pathway protein I
MRADEGFTLVEVLVALALLGIGLAALVQVVPAATLAAARAQARLEALALAQARLETLGVDAALLPGGSAGVAPGGYRWRVSARPLAPGGPGGSPTPAALEAIEVGVEVTWVAGGRRGSLVLTSIRLRAPGSAWAF